MIGPQLPTSAQSKDTEEVVEETSNSFEPAIYGPTIPDISKLSGESQKEINPSEPDSDEDEEPSSSIIGPSIPKHFYGPTIPGNGEDEDEDTPSAYGPTLPPVVEVRAGPVIDSDEDDDIGPKPVSKGDEERENLERAYRLAAQQEAEADEKNSQSKREEWMTSVPKSMGNFGLGPRTFKTGTAVERDSTWEDAPGAKKKRKTEEKSTKSAGIAAADARQAAIVAQKEAGPSLMEIHQKKREEKAAETKYGANERRPFDREKDMEVRGLRPGGSKEVADRMKEFASRFANSKDQRFL